MAGTRLFLCHAAQDAPSAQELDKHLVSLKHKGTVETWHVQQLLPGSSIKESAETAFANASIFVPLISQDFLYVAECRALLEQAALRQMYIVPVLVRPSSWQQEPLLAGLKPLPDLAETVSTHPQGRDAAWVQIADGLAETIRAHAATRTSTQEATPFPLPQPGFCGRDAALAALAKEFEGRSVQIISGLGGMGKTQLALAYAEKQAGSYGMQLYLLADSPATLRTEIARLAHQLGLPTTNSEAQIHAFRRCLINHSGWLLLIDNADDLTVLRPMGLLDLRGHILITTRQADAGPLGRVLPLSKLDPDEALRLLQRETARDASEDEALRQLAREVDYLPLALAQAAAYLRANSTPVANYLRSFRLRRTDLMKVPLADGDERAAVATTWSMNLAQVREASPEAAALLECSAFLAPDAIPEELFVKSAACLDTLLQQALASAAEDPVVIDEVLGPLLRYSLIHRDPLTQTISVHRLVQQVVERSLPKEQKLAWKERAVAAVSLSFPEVVFENWPKCRRFLSHALLCAEHIEQEGLTSQAATELLTVAGHFLSEQGQYHDAETLLRQALRLGEAALGTEHPAIAAVLNKLGWVCQNTCSNEEARGYYEHALVLRERTLGPEHLLVACVLDNLGLLAADRGDLAQSEALHLRSLQIRDKALGSDHRDIAKCLNNLGLVCQRQGRFAEAEAYYERALSIRRRVLGEDHPDITLVYTNLASLKQAKGQYTEAARLYTQVLATRERLLPSMHMLIAESLNNLAVLYQYEGRHTQAQPLLQRALSIYEATLEPQHPAVGQGLCNLAVNLQALGHYQEAEPLLHRALAIVRHARGEDHPELAYPLASLAFSLRRRKANHEAEALLREALSLQERGLPKDSLALAPTLEQLAITCTRLGKSAEAQSLRTRREGILAAHASAGGGDQVRS